MTQKAIVPVFGLVSGTPLGSTRVEGPSLGLCPLLDPIWFWETALSVLLGDKKRRNQKMRTKEMTCSTLGGKKKTNESK